MMVRPFNHLFKHLLAQGVGWQFDYAHLHQCDCQREVRLAAMLCDRPVDGAIFLMRQQHIYQPIWC